MLCYIPYLGIVLLQHFLELFGQLVLAEGAGRGVTQHGSRGIIAGYDDVAAARAGVEHVVAACLGLLLRAERLFFDQPERCFKSLRGEESLCLLHGFLL